MTPITRRSLVLLSCCGLVAGCVSSRPTRPSPAASDSVVIDTLAIRAHTFFLADDRLLGRETGSPGAKTAALYISAQCRALGLRAIGSDYELPVSLARANTGRSTLQVGQSGGAVSSFRAPSDFVVQGGVSRTLVDFTGGAVLVGSQDDILAGRTPPVRGAVAVSLGLVPPGAGTDTLIARGAVGLLQLTSNDSAYRGWAAEQGSDVTYVADSAVRSSYFANLPSVVAGPAASRAVVAGRGDLEPGPLTAVVTVHLRLEARALGARNVGCWLRGHDPARVDTAIAFTAHLDHLGIGVPDAYGDSIYNGFSDNAAGVAMLLAIAEAMGREPEGPRHSMLFLFFTGEERGLLGSDYYVSHPAWPLRRMAAVINLDAGAPSALVWNWRIAGGDSSWLGRVAVDVALSRGWSAVTSGPRANSDYFPFLRVGVPAIFLVPGPAPYQGLSADSSQALRRRWDHYHQPSDEWRADFPFAGLARYAEFALRIARAVDRTGS